MDGIKKKACISALVCALVFLVSALEPAQAESFFDQKGANYDRVRVGVDQQGNSIYTWTTHPERIIDTYDWSGNPVYKDYRLFQDANFVYLETMNAGSLIFDKLSCKYDFYERGYLNGQTPKVRDISWTVKGKAAASSTWSNVNAVNTALCVVTIDTTESTVRITGEKAASVGTFQIVLDYEPGKGIKETMRAYNNNPAWTNHHIGFTETFEVPQTIKFGNNEYNLANYNGTTLSRNWIENNKAKLVSLNNNLFYDVGIGFANLDNIAISWDGSKAKLSLNYLFINQIVPYQQWVEVDPTFGWASGTAYRTQTTTAAGVACPGAPYSSYGGTEFVFGDASGSVGQCIRTVIQFDTTTIPNLATITDTDFRYDVTATPYGGAKNCDFTQVDIKPSTATDAQRYDDTGTATVYVNNDAGCTTISNDKTIDLGASADTKLESQLGVNWFGVRIKYDDEVRGGVAYGQQSTGTFDLQVTYTVPPGPYAVTDLTATQVTTVSAMLSWTAPNPNGGTIVGYMVNMSAGGGTPNTKVVNNTGTTATTYLVTGLLQPTNSFRVGAWTQYGTNATGNIATLTGISFTIGNINVTATNDDTIGIRFVRNNTNATSTDLTVVYADSYTMDCNIGYEFAQTNRTYTNLTGSASSTTGFDEYTFTFLNSDNEVIGVRCWDQSTNATGYYVLTQTTFPILEQIANFRAGAYGTSGMFGMIDMITLFVIILSMIGFNRVDETVGVIFNVFLVFGLAYFGIITWTTAMMGFFAIGVVFALAKNRGD